jgi:hypothetical protein
MNNLQLGKMYLVKEYFWYVFPTKELAWPAGRGPRRSDQTMATVAKLLSERYKCNVSFVEENTYVVLLEMDETEHCYKLLDSNGNIGWIYCFDFSDYFELVKE